MRLSSVQLATGFTARHKHPSNEVTRLDLKLGNELGNNKKLRGLFLFVTAFAQNRNPPTQTKLWDPQLLTKQYLVVDERA